MRNDIKVAIAGVGNCASALVQGVEYYRNRQGIAVEGIMSAKPFGEPSGSSSSYGGNPLAAAAGLAAVEAILDEKLVENSARVGALMLGALKELQNKYRFIGDVRGRGLMIGVELVADRATKVPLDRTITRALFHGARSVRCT